MTDKSGLLEYSTSQKRNLYNWQNKDIMRGIQKAEPYWFKLNFCVENFLLTLAATQLSWYCNNLSSVSFFICGLFCLAARTVCLICTGTKIVTMQHIAHHRNVQDTSVNW